MISQNRCLKIGYEYNFWNGRPDFCPVCRNILLKVKNAMDFIVRGCHGCLKIYYYEKRNKRLIELVIPFEDFFNLIECSNTCHKSWLLV